MPFVTLVVSKENILWVKLCVAFKKCSFPKGALWWAGGGEGCAVYLAEPCYSLKKVIKTKWKHLAFESTALHFTEHNFHQLFWDYWGRGDWIWSRFAGGCLTSVFVSELSKGRKGLLLLFSCVQSIFISSQPGSQRLKQTGVDTRPSHWQIFCFKNRGFSTLATSWIK